MRSSDDSDWRSAGPPRKAVDVRISLVAQGALLPWRLAPSVPDRSTDDIIRTIRTADARPGFLVLGGGNPLERADLSDLLSAIASMRPDGFGVCLPGPGVGEPEAERLRAAGVGRVLVPFHCARQDAHDWLVGRSGALRAAHRAIRACLAANLPVVAEIVVTRPTMPHLAETIEVLARTGVRTVCIRRLAAEDTRGTEFVSLSPRLALLEASLEEAARVALERRLRVILRDLPLCAAPRLRPLLADPDSEVWLLPDGTSHARSARTSGCAACPGTPHCAGAPHDYVARFGWEEFLDREAGLGRVHENVEEQRAVPSSEPMVFNWSGPHRVRCEACGDGREDRAKSQQPYESTRVIRARMVQAARQRPSVVRLVGADLLAHPQSALLIYDALRLFPRVQVAGEASPIVDWSDLDLRRLKELRRLDVALYGPDAAAHDAHCGIPGAFAALQRAVERVRTHAAIPIGAYAILHDARSVSAFAEAWQQGLLPGEPAFRLSGRGGSLDELAEAARQLPAGAARSALVAVLSHAARDRAGLAVDAKAPPTAAADQRQQRMQYGRSTAYEPSGSDPLGAFEPCQDGAPCATVGCPGNAVGWHSTARSERWSGSSI